ncbi:MAG: hypothetical protein D6698_12670 [Gammaproteobacteria bacterium]|nr:MAG: hypothetical protein D6698_12670 [Gammaproteobacteria bacterium]
MTEDTDDNLPERHDAIAEGIVNSGTLAGKPCLDEITERLGPLWVIRDVPINRGGLRNIDHQFPKISEEEM